MGHVNQDLLRALGQLVCESLEAARTDGSRLHGAYSTELTHTARDVVQDAAVSHSTNLGVKQLENFLV